MKFEHDYSGYENEVLYRMCREKPLHDDIDVIKAKFLIIGRVYSAAIERKAGPNFKPYTNPDVWRRIQSSEIDRHIHKLNHIDRITFDNAPILFEAHYQLTSLLKDITGINKRSLASKYLHFHSPKSVFIYDSLANKGVRQKLSKKYDLTGNFDDEYEGFVYRCIDFRDAMLESKLGFPVSPRRLDMELLGYSFLTNVTKKEK
jgi:hypothetical protein